MTILLVLLFCFSVAFSQDEPAYEPAYEPEPAPEATSEFDSWSEPVLEAEPEPENLQYKEAARVSNEPLLSVRGWTRVATFSLAVATGVGAIVMHSNASKSLDKIDNLNAAAVKAGGFIGMGDFNEDGSKTPKRHWKELYVDEAYKVDVAERNRNILAGASGVLVTVGVLTFFF